VIHHAKLAAALLLIVASFGMFASPAFLLPALALGGVLATLTLAAQR
jgi:hypothetical protein